MRRFNLGFLLAFFFLSGCGQDRNVEFFKETEAYELARAIADNDTSLIERLVKEKPSLLKVTAYKTGSYALDLAPAFGIVYNYVGVIINLREEQHF